MLILTLVPVTLLSEYLAVIVDFGLEGLRLPDSLGGVLVATLVLSPEGLIAFHAALRNQLQRAVNACLGSALATIGLTIPAVLVIGLNQSRRASWARSGPDGTSDPHPVRERAYFRRRATNVLQGTVHLLSCSSSILH
jgi:Ca2+:H+ antiporter